MLMEDLTIAPAPRNIKTARCWRELPRCSDANEPPEKSTKSATLQRCASDMIEEGEPQEIKRQSIDWAGTLGSEVDRAPEAHGNGESRAAHVCMSRPLMGCGCMVG